MWNTEDVLNTKKLASQSRAIVLTYRIFVGVEFQKFEPPVILRVNKKDNAF
jgi:hypothetical protein